jgi:Leucine-rich repeat (LRR) protein
MKKHYYFLTTFFLTQLAFGQIVYIPDANFKNALLTEIDTNRDGEIQESEAKAVLSLNVSSKSIASLEGIQSFVNLETLNCYDNQLTDLDVSNLVNLKYFYCDSNKLQWLRVSGLVNLLYLSCSTNQLTSLDVRGSVKLTTVDCSYNQLTTLKVSGLTNLTDFSCSNNQLQSLDVSGLVKLKELYCRNNQLPILNVNGLMNLEKLYCGFNQLPSLDVSSLTKLLKLDCSNNQLPSLDVSGLVNLTYLYCGFNQLPSLDVSGLANLIYLYCSGNHKLVTLFVKNGRKISNLYIEKNTALKYICADEANISYYLNAATTNGYTNCQVNTYCSFMPGGTFYTLQGKTTVDVDANGCDANDNTMPYLKYLISGNAGNGGVIADNTGNYTIALQAGAYTITPQLENSAYFTVSPTNISVNFPMNVSPVKQDFCIIPKGVHNDVELTLIPLDRARPGFDTKYKLVYKNKGNTTLSGSLTLNFQDDVMNFLNATPNVASQTPNTLMWDYANLKPFDSKEIFFTMKLNTPIDATNPLVGGAVLAFTATINPVITDETALDNVFELNQTVINSFDPNDKTCLEGTKITPEIVGNYVHYMIRFENTGSAEAVNIVVKDKIDSTKFDISTLIPEDASHNFVTNIKKSNDVEFIFEGINLPFDDANNDGYVSFKIKTLPTLAIGSTFENGSEIYFDYNAPIVTNIATTEVAVSLGVPEMAVSVSNVFPNPVATELTVENEHGIKEITIFDALGRTVKKVVPLSISNALHIEMIQLHTGIYFVKTVSTQGVGIQKIMKN